MLLTACSKQDSIKDTDKNSCQTYAITYQNDQYFNWDSIIQDVSFIRLENSKSGMMGKINKGFIDSSGIYLLDNRSNILKKFDHYGTFLTNIGNKGKGPGEFREFRDFEMVDDIIYGLDYMKIQRYTNDGNFLGSIPFKINDEFNPSSLAVFSKDHFLLACYNPDVYKKDTTYPQILRIRSGKVEDRYMTHRVNNFDDFVFCKSIEKGKFYIRPDLDDYLIREVTNDSLSAKCYFDFKDRAWNEAILNKIIKQKERNGKLNNQYVKSLDNIIDSHNFLLLDCIGPKAYTYNILISKLSGKILFGRKDHIGAPKLLGYFDGYFYGYIEPVRITEKTSNIPPNKSFFSCLPNEWDVKYDDNFLLVKFKIRT